SPSSLPPSPTSTLLPYTTLFRSLAVRLVGAHQAVALLLLQRVGGFAAKVADLDARLFHALVDDPDQVPATLFREGREVETDHGRSEEHTSELQSRVDLVCRLLLE